MNNIFKEIEKIEEKFEAPKDLRNKVQGSYKAISGIFGFLDNLTNFFGFVGLNFLKDFEQKQGLSSEQKTDDTQTTSSKKEDI
ncbi:MAG: hypothetical protein R2798_08210 [Chitinophagales bacterium]|nr:hypothetical protein [Bacteroidota bacterium]MCB9042418.1 hypothetical protein [Chitinophagales bacterium]